MKPKTEVIPIRADSDLTKLIAAAEKETRVNSAEIIRCALRIGVPQFVSRLTGKPLNATR